MKRLQKYLTRIKGRASGVLIAAMLISGCGDRLQGPALLSVSGKVTLNGQPVESGDIIFRPASGNGHAYAGRIENGEFTLECEAGAKQVEITSFREIPGKFNEENPGEQTPVTEQIIPDEYNAQTTLKVSVEGGGSNDFPFELTGPITQ